MNHIYVSLQVFIILSFFCFGIGCFLSSKAAQEFDRYGFKNQEKIIGSLQILASLGLCLAYFLNSGFLTLLISCCLALMMAFATSIRIKIKDSFILMMPALIYFLICLVFFLKTLVRLKG